MRTDANIHKPDGGSVTEALPGINPPADFRNYRARQQLITRRNATDDPVKRERLNLLIEQMNEHDKCAPDDHERRTLLRRSIMAQMAIGAF